VSWCLGGEIRLLLSFVGVLSLLAGCVGAGRVVPVSSFPQLEETATVELGSSVAAICQDGEALLALENSGTRVVRYSLALTALDTLPLTERVTAPVGIAADRFYIYIYDDHNLYRMSKDKLNLQAWLGDIRVAGLAGFEPGIMLVSDIDHGAIWYKGLFGESRLFISASEIARPGAMVALKDGTFAALSTASRLLCFFNRSGVVTRSLSLPAACDLLAANDQGLLCMGVRGKPQTWVLKSGKMIGYSLPDSVSPVSFAVVGTSIAVLDAGTRIRVYRLPETE
jgi:hypothetical protein